MYSEKKSFHVLRVFPNETKSRFLRRLWVYFPRMFLERQSAALFSGNYRNLIVVTRLFSDEAPLLVPRTTEFDLFKQ